MMLASQGRGKGIWIPGKKQYVPFLLLDVGFFLLETDVTKAISSYVCVLWWHHVHVCACVVFSFLNKINDEVHVKKLLICRKLKNTC